MHQPPKYGQWAAGTYPTGMHSCLICFFWHGWQKGMLHLTKVGSIFSFKLNICNGGSRIFQTWEGTPTSEFGAKTYYLIDLRFCQKLHENERNWTERGRAFAHNTFNNDRSILNWRELFTIWWRYLQTIVQIRLLIKFYTNAEKTSWISSLFEQLNSC